MIIVQSFAMTWLNGSTFFNIFNFKEILIWICFSRFLLLYIYDAQLQYWTPQLGGGDKIELQIWSCITRSQWHWTLRCFLLQLGAKDITQIEWFYNAMLYELILISVDITCRIVSQP